MPLRGGPAVGKRVLLDRDASGAVGTPRPLGRAPIWLRLLILAVAVWLAVRIVGNVTETLTGMVEGGGAAAMVSATR